ncbi:uncharacterized protein LOC131651552 [Vicia villosa]|uniref:uncharacterized protein LOC131651552 n=1 Tax=Vicia villosa TaxID=3911 RepID=UPI00273AAA00|nr:uncharacterized protein LOC131651552 [Vicia villosa]
MEDHYSLSLLQVFNSSPFLFSNILLSIHMARPIDYVKDINESNDLWKIVVSCKHIWSVTSSSDKEHIEMRDMIQAIVCTYLVSKFKSEIAAGNLPDIPAYYLNLLRLDAIVEGRFQSNVLVDILGGITEFSQSQINGDNNKNRVVFTIADTNKSDVQCTLWGQLAVQLYEYYKNNKEDSNIVIVLIITRVKEAQGGFPVSVSNTWNGTKLLINDLRFDEVKKLKEILGNDLVLLSTSSLQVKATQNSYYSDFDKFLWKAEIISLSEITNLQHFEAGQMGWFYDGCVECTRSVALKDGKLQCYATHVSSEPVPRYKLEVLAVDGNSKAKFIFWDTDCVKLIVKSALQMKMDLIEASDYDPLEFPYELDSILKKEFAIIAVFQPKNVRLSVIGFKNDEDYRKKIKDSFKGEEHTSKLETPDPLSQDDIISWSEPVSTSAD